MLIRTAEEFLALVGRLRAGPDVMVYDLETTGLDPFKGDRLIGVAVLIPDMSGRTDGESFYAPFRHPHGNLPPALLRRLAPLLADENRSLVGFNLKFDVHFTEAEGMPVRNALIDVMLAAHLANENEMGFSLKGLGAKYIGADAAAPEHDLFQALRDRGVKDKSGIKLLPPEVVAPYAEQDVRLTWQLARHYTMELGRQGIAPLWPGVNEYLGAIVAMEQHGVLINPAGCRKNLVYANRRRAALYKQMKGLVGHDFNPDSVPQLRKILGQQATDRKAMAVCKHPVAPLLIKSRSWGKAVGTFYQAFLDLMDDNHRVHPNLSLIGTISSRLSCSHPNLQALPKTSDVHKIRDLIIAPPGYSLMSWDWSQIELRILAHYSKDGFLLDAFRNGKDIHGETAARLNLPRDLAKRINFGVIYGVGADTLSKELGVPRAQAKEYLDRYNYLIPGVRQLYNASQHIAGRDHRIPMWTGRLRHYGPEDETYKAMSNLIQGGVAEMMRIAITCLHRELRDTGARMVLQVHDEVLFEAPAGTEAGLAVTIKRIMEDFNFDVPVVVDGKIGRSWGAGGMRPIAFNRSGEPVIPRLGRRGGT